MKKKILALATFVLTIVALMCVTVFSASAEDDEPSVEIAKFNLAFEDNTYLKYAVRFDGVDDAKITENNIGMLYWTSYEGGFVPGTEDFSSKTTGYTTIDGVKHYVFEYTHLAAKQLTDYIYSVAYLELDGTTYYSEPVKYSALEYAYNRLGKTSEGTTDEELKALLNNMLAYGASAQQYFDYKEDRLATADFYQITLVGGTLEDGFASGLYLSTDEVIITAPEIDGDLNFAGWQNSAGETVFVDCVATVENIVKNETYMATYSETETSTYSNGLAYILNDDGESYSVTGIGTCTDIDIIIPSTYKNYPITSISANAFKYNTTIRSLTTGENMISIGDYAFYNCTSLTTLTGTDSLERIERYAFSNCSSLANVHVGKSFNYFPLSAFYFCFAMSNIEIDDENPYYCSIDGSCYDKSGTVLLRYAVGKADTHFSIPDTVNTINNQALYGASNLISLSIPNSVTKIGSGAFYGCSSLTSIEIPDGVTSIGYNAFSSCSSLTSIEVSESNTAYKSIDGNLYTKDGKTLIQYAIGKTDASFTIPDSVTSIGDYAFYDCSSLTSINFGGTKAQWNAITKNSSWDSQTGDYTVYCTDGTIAK